MRIDPPILWWPIFRSSTMLYTVRAETCHRRASWAAVKFNVARTASFVPHCADLPAPRRPYFDDVLGVVVIFVLRLLFHFAFRREEPRAPCRRAPL